MWNALIEDFGDLVELERLTHIVVRLVIAILLGGLLGYQREKAGKAAGLRTHMLVAAGAAFFVLVPVLDGMPKGDISRVLQGIITGVGFLGAGAILKHTDAGQIHGLTTAAGIWLTAAVGIAAGFGRLGSALITAVLAFIILEFLHRLEPLIDRHDDQNENSDSTRMTI